MTRSRHLGGALMVGLLYGSIGAADRVLAQAPTLTPPAAKSGVHAKELSALLSSRKLESYAVRDPSDPKRFVAVFHIPNVQLLVISGMHDRPADLDYGFYQKDFMSVYQDLNSSPMVTSKTFVEDAVCDGLVALPAKTAPRDAVTIATKRRTFDGDFSDPKHKDAKKISQEDYLKAFAEADELYDHLLVMVIDELKKG
jgi:hypothetical protein